MKKSIIEEIFWDNQGYVEKIQPSEEFKKVSGDGYEIYRKLNKFLDESQKSILDDLMDSEMGKVAEASLTHFKEGVKVGLLLAMECII